MLRRNAGYLLALLGLLAVGLFVTIGAIRQFNRSLGTLATVLPPTVAATETSLPTATPLPSPELVIP